MYISPGPIPFHNAAIQRWRPHRSQRYKSLGAKGQMPCEMTYVSGQSSRPSKIPGFRSGQEAATTEHQTPPGLDRSFSTFALFSSISSRFSHLVASFFPQNRIPSVKPPFSIPNILRNHGRSSQRHCWRPSRLSQRHAEQGLSLVRQHIPTRAAERTHGQNLQICDREAHAGCKTPLRPIRTPT